MFPERSHSRTGEAAFTASFWIVPPSAAERSENVTGGALLFARPSSTPAPARLLRPAVPVLNVAIPGWSDTGPLRRPRPGFHLFDSAITHGSMCLNACEATARPSLTSKDP